MTRAQSTLQSNAEFTDVKSHPLAEHLFATSDSHGEVCLRDSRMAFGPLVNRTREGIVRVVSNTSQLFTVGSPKRKTSFLQYNTKLSKRGFSHLSNPESSSITFDRQGLSTLYSSRLQLFRYSPGTRLGVTMLVCCSRTPPPPEISTVIPPALHASYLQRFGSASYCHMQWTLSSRWQPCASRREIIYKFVHHEGYRSAL